MCLLLYVDARQPQLHWWRGRALGQLERWSEAREHFEIAAALAPKNPAMWQGLLSATTAQQDLDATRLAVEFALELQPDEKPLLDLKRDVVRLLERH
jgi:Flp pilus assembly protein TadD